jgi:anti-anti-sigma regulatory factor
VAIKVGQHTLKITVHENDEAVEIILEGRVAGPWVAELSHTWLDLTATLNGRSLSIDLRNVTYSDAKGKQVLQDIYVQTGARLVTSTPLTQYLAEEIHLAKGPNTGEEAGHGKQV